MASSDDLNEYLWIVVLGCVLGFVYAFGIGANDVANAFASTVASKSLTLRQAVVVAGIFEFAGAILLGASVTGTVRGKIFDLSLYDDEPEIVMLGFFTSLLTGSVMLLVATHYGLPVSTTHTIVGAIIGFTTVAKGFDSVNRENMKKIFISWVASPLCAGFGGFVLFAFVRHVIMKSRNPFNTAYYSFPFVIMAGVGIDAFYVLYKGFNNLDFQDKLELKWVLPASFGFGAILGFFWLLVVGPWAKGRIEARRAQIDAEVADAEKDVDKLEDDEVVDDEAATEHFDAAEADTNKKSSDSEEEEDEEEAAPVKSTRKDVHVSDHNIKDDYEEGTAEPGALSFKDQFNAMAKQFADSTYNQDLYSQSMHENKGAKHIWDNGEEYDEDSEQLFTYIQVFTACLNAFAHGANDIANAIAPLSGILYIYRNGEVSSNSDVQKWILVYGGAALVLGFLFYGYKTIKSIGYKLTKLSPSRGACAELAASLFVVTASFREIPVSTTQCIVGAVSGVGLVEGVKNVQWLFLLRVCVSWAVVFVSAGVLNAGVFAMFAYSPSLITPSP
ncbi:hypothetical protein ACA910_015245 [Epithemia clementina (nom. ined.)]